MPSPTQVNFLSPNGYSFNVLRLPEVQYFVQKINLPGITLGQAIVPTPFTQKVPYSGDMLFNDLIVTFKVDEAMESYTSIWLWMTALGFPQKFAQYAALAQSVKFPPNFEQGNITSDLNVLILDNKHNPFMQVRYISAFPVSIGDLTFTSTDSTINYITVDVNFKYSWYEMTPL